MFNSQAIGIKLRRWFIINTCLLFIMLAGSFTIFEMVQLKQMGLKQTQSLADLLILNVTNAIAAGDKEAAISIMSALKANDSIDAAVLMDAKNNWFAGFHQTYDDQTVLRENYKNKLLEYSSDRAQHHYQDGFLKLSTPIYMEGNLIGTLHLFDNYHYLENAILNLILLSLISIAFSMVVAWLVSKKVQQAFTKPLMALKDTMSKVSEEKNYNMQISTDIQDEISDLYISFNHMLREIHERDRALKSQNQFLEEEVNKRTKEIHMANEQLSHYAAKAYEGRQQAEDLAKSKAAFLANMSHEIRTPLNGVIGIIEILNKTPLDERQKEFIEIAKISSDTLLGIINDVLDYSKIEADQLLLEERAINIREIVETTARQFASSASHKGLEISCVIDPKMEVHYKGDELRIRQVLSNLISNAIKFTLKGNIHIKVLGVKSAKNEIKSTLYFEVEDSGVGIRPESISKIFDSFIQEDSSTTRQFGGSGLGLNISKKIVEMMGGEISVQSVYGQGTIFKFNIHLTNLEEVETEKSPQLELADTRVLIVDDNEVNCRILEAYLTAWSIECVSLTDPGKVLPYLAESDSLNCPINCVMLDYHMPTQNGLQLTSDIRKHYSRDNLKIILISSLALDFELVPEAGHDIQGYMTKPIQQTELLKIMTNVITSKALVQKEMTPKKERIEKTGLNVLVAEDYEINQHIITIMLESLGCHVTIANHGLEAFEKIKQFQYDIVFMDCQMPILDGFDASKKIRIFEKKCRVKTPIIALTGNVTEQDKSKCFQAGMDDFLKKPYSENEIIEKINKWSNVNLEFTPILKNADENSIKYLDTKKYTSLIEMDENGAFLNKITILFKDSSLEKINILYSALENKDYESIGNIAHMLKGSCANIGAAKLTNLFENIEFHVKNNDQQAVDECCKELQVVYDKTIALLDMQGGQT